VASNSAQIDVDRPSAVASVIVLGAVGSMVFMILPMLIGAFSDRLALGRREIGWVGSADMSGMFLSAVVATWWIRRVDWRPVAWAASALLVASHLLSAQLTGFVPLVAVRFLAGFAGGALMSVALTALGDGRDPDRFFGLFICAQMTLGAVGLWAVPGILERFGLPGLFQALAGLSAAAALAIPLVPRAGRPPRSRSGAAGERRSLLPGVAALVACLVFNLGIMAIWAYAERIGNAAGLPAEGIGRALGGSLLAGLAGAMLAAALGRRLGRIVPIAATLALQAVALWLLAGELSAAGYLAAVLLFSFGWNFPVPYQLAITVSVDPSGRLVVLFLSAVKLGYAVAPALAAQLIGPAGGYGTVLTLGGVCFALSAAVYVAIVRFAGEPARRGGRGGDEERVPAISTEEIG
jgi:predicted MFS family arabinose efflux permease